MYNFKNKRILITAGPTWVPIDSVRVISNIATGETGILLARGLNKRGAKVSLVLGPVSNTINDKGIEPGIKLIKFKFFDELKNIIIQQIKTRRYDIVIHTAAVSDYRPKPARAKKIKSGIKKLNLVLEPTPKIIDYIKQLDPKVVLIGFKFEPGSAKNRLLKEAKCLMRRSNLDLTVANTILDNRYQAYIILKDKISAALYDKRNLVKKLLEEIGEYLWKKETCRKNLRE